MIIASLNINGGCNLLRKVQTMQLINNIKGDILLLQETHATHSCKLHGRLEAEVERHLVFFSNTASVSAGVAFYISARLPISSLVFKEIVPGYLAVIDFMYNRQRILIVNVYAPSDSTVRTAFFTESFTFLNHLTPDSRLCLGDYFICTLDPVRDRNSPEPHPARARPLSTLLLQHDLGDVWRPQHGNVQQFTWCRCLLNNMSLARLDKFYISLSLFNRVSFTDIATSGFSDHF